MPDVTRDYFTTRSERDRAYALLVSQGERAIRGGGGERWWIERRADPVTIVREGTLEVEVDDGGAALVGHLGDGTDGDDRHLFVRIQSYDERVWDVDPESVVPKRERVAMARAANPDIHREFASLEGKRLRVTIEVLDQ